MRIGTQLTLAVGAVLVLVGIGYGGLYLIGKGRYIDRTLSDNAERAALIVTTLHEAGLRGEAAHTALTRIADHLDLVTARITGPSGEVLLDWGTAGNIPEISRLRHTIPLPDGGQVVVAVRFPEQDASLFRGRNLDIAMVAVVTLALLLIVSQLSRINVERPLARLTRTVERIAKGELDARHPPGEPGEIGLLADRFNAMAETIETQTSELVREREYERNILQNVSGGIVGIDRDGVITTWNDAMAGHYAVSAEEAVGKPFSGICPQVLPKEVARAARSLLSGKRKEFDLTDQLHETARVGERVLDVRGRVLVDDHGEIYGAVLAVDDRTEPARLTDQLRHAEKLATVGQLAAGLAHEIGTPLNVISGRAEFVLKKLPEGDSLGRHLTRIVGQIDRISGIVSQMLVFARKRPPVKERVVLAAVVDEVVELLDHQMEQAHIDLSLHVPEKLWLNADPGQVQQVLMNLMMNAMQALVSGGTITVSASTVCVPARDDATFVLLTVTDTGPGMEEQVAGRIFDPFFTTKEPGRGTGMGLTVAHGIVSAHGGWIEVASSPGEGTTFSVYLPRAGIDQPGMEPPRMGPLKTEPPETEPIDD